MHQKTDIPDPFLSLGLEPTESLFEEGYLCAAMHLLLANDSVTLCKQGTSCKGAFKVWLSNSYCTTQGGGGFLGTIRPLEAL